jgi:hypothetical protein
MNVPQGHYTYKINMSEFAHYVECIGLKYEYGFWNDVTHHTIYMVWLGKVLDYDTIEDWYKITRKQIVKYGGGGLLSGHYYNSTPKLINAIFPDYEWVPWKFQSVSKGFWKDIANHTRFVVWLGKELGHNTMDDWYKITAQQIIDNRGGGILANYYHSSPSCLVMAAFPDYEWVPHQFNIRMVANDVSEDISNQTSFVVWVGGT